MSANLAPPQTLAAPPRRAFGLIEAHPLTREQRTRERAFAIYEDRVRTGAPGSPEADWLRAEEELAEPAPGPAPRPTRVTTRERTSALPASQRIS